MKRSIFIRLVALLVVLITLVGCSRGGESSKKEEVQLSDKQRQSLAMLNYLTAVTQEITVSKDDRVFLENAYSTLYNNLYLDAVDACTQEHVTDIMDILERLRMIDVRRARLQYIYEQDIAKAIENETLKPKDFLGLAEAVIGSGSKDEIKTNALKATASVVDMVWDSTTVNTDDVERQYLLDGWELDDATATELHNACIDAFSYMATKCRDEEIPGEYAMTSETIGEFIKYKTGDNLISLIQFLESHEATYKMYGDYWLVLAESYYDTDEFDKCLKSIQEYEKLNENVRIFRKDYSYAQILPAGIISARETYKQDKYVSSAEKYLQAILANTDDGDWAIRYFATQVYMDLFQITGKSEHLENAYEVIKNVVNALAAEQRDINRLYMEDVVEEKLAENATESQKADAEQHNKMLKEIRETELPPISEPLRICGEMLFALADELQVSAEEKNKLEKMLHSNGDDLYYNLLLDGDLRINPDETDPQVANMTVKYDAEGNLKLPVILVTQNSYIKVSAVGKSKTTVFEDWTLKKVERKGENVEEFLAVYKSKKAADFEYKDGMAIIIEIYGSPEAETPDYTVEFKAKVDTTLWLFDDVSFKRVS